MRIFVTLVLAFFYTCSNASVVRELEKAWTEASTELVELSEQEDDRVEQLKQDWNELLAALRLKSIKLVVTPQHFAQAFPGRVVAVHPVIASLPRVQRMFIMAHEVGHVVHNDYDKFIRWATQADRKLKFVGDVSTQEQMSSELAASLRAHSHAGEFSADKFAADALRKMKLDPKVGVLVLEPLVGTPATDTHPEAGQRIQRVVRQR